MTSNKPPTTRGERILLASALAIFYLLLGMIIVQDEDAGGGPTMPLLRGFSDISGKGGSMLKTPPAGTVTGDLILLFIETAGESVGTVSGYTELSCSPSEHGSGCPGGVQCTWLTVFYRIATGSDNASIGDSGNHQIAGVVGLQEGTFDAADPIGICEVDGDNGGTSVVINGVTTTTDLSYMIASATGTVPDKNDLNQFNSEANDDWDAIAEIDDECSNAGNGGCLVYWGGGNTTAGSLGQTTATADDTGGRAYMTISINPDPG
jgi:hypothetical protein